MADKGDRMMRYYGFLSPAKRRLLEEVVYIITETVRKKGDANHPERDVSAVTEG